MTEREVFLAQVALAVRRAELPARPERPENLIPDLPEGDLWELFSDRLREVDGEAHRVSVADAARTVAEIASRYETGPFLAWSELPAPGVNENLESRGFVPVDSTVTSENRSTRTEELAEVVLGVTGADAALAETGSVVVRSGPGRPRMASLVPLVHVALIPADRVFRSLSHWSGHADVADAANVVVITGPSRTGDIEQHLNLGVHGPRHLHVVIVDPPAG